MFLKNWIFYLHFPIFYVIISEKDDLKRDISLVYESFGIIFFKSFWDFKVIINPFSETRCPDTFQYNEVANHYEGIKTSIKKKGIQIMKKSRKVAIILAVCILAVSVSTVSPEIFACGTYT